MQSETPSVDTLLSKTEAAARLGLGTYRTPKIVTDTIDSLISSGQLKTAACLPPTIRRRILESSVVALVATWKGDASASA